MDFLYDGEPLGITTVQAGKCHHHYVHADTVKKATNPNMLKKS